MSDTRLAIREFRFLDEKRKLTTLSTNEEQRWRELKQVLGVAEPRPPATPPPSADVDPGQAHYSDANGYPALGSSEPTGLDFNPDQMYGGSSPGPIAPPNLGSMSSHYSPYATPGYGQSPAALSDRYRTEQQSEDSTLPAAELLGLTEPAAVEAPTPADIQNGPVGGDSEPPLEPTGSTEDVIELDPSEVTLLESESMEVQGAIAVQAVSPAEPEPAEPPVVPTGLPQELSAVGAQSPEEASPDILPPVALVADSSTEATEALPPIAPMPDSSIETPEAFPPVALVPDPSIEANEVLPPVGPMPDSSTEATEALPPVVPMPGSSTDGPENSEGITIDLSSAEAIDTGEFAPAQPAPAEEPPAIEMAPPATDAFDHSVGGMAPDGKIAAPVFTQAPVALEEQQSTVPTSLVPGEHRVIVHTHEGQVKRGVIRDADLWGHAIALEHSGQAETLPTDRIKAIFFMVPGGAGQAAPTGQKVRVTLADGRQVVGFSTDFRGEAPGFFLVPADVRTNTSRVYLFRSAVDLITEE